MNFDKQPLDFDQINILKENEIAAQRRIKKLEQGQSVKDIQITDTRSSNETEISESVVIPPHTDLESLDSLDHPQYDYDKTGWPILTDSDISISFDDGTRTLTLTPASLIEYWIGGVSYTISVADTVTISDIEGLWFIYYVGSVLTPNQTVWDIEDNDKALVCLIYWDATNNKAIRLGREWHTFIMDHMTHQRLHTQGTIYKSGLTLGNMTTDGDGSSDTHAQFSVADGVITDEDLDNIITDDSPQDLSTIAQIPIFYLSGATPVWRRVDATNFPVTTTGTGRAAWNELTGGSWQLTEVTNNQYVLYHYFATNDVVHPIIGIVGQADHTTLIAARSAAETEINSLITSGLPTIEYIPIATVIWQTANAYTNTPKSRIRTTSDGDDYISWLGVDRQAIGATPTSHTQLDDIGTNTHAEIDTHISGEPAASIATHTAIAAAHHAKYATADWETDAGITSALLLDSLKYLVANRSYKPCSYRGHSAGSAFDDVVSNPSYITINNSFDSYVVFDFDEPTSLNGLSLWLDAVTMLVFDADGSNYIDQVLVRGITHTGVTNLINETTNRTAQGAYETTITAVDVSSYDMIIVLVLVNTATDGDLDFLSPKLRTYYA
jgi:hypothetical protein